MSVTEMSITKVSFTKMSWIRLNIFACNCSYEKNVIVRINREYDYFGNVLEYEYDYFPSYSSMSTSTQKVLVLEYEYTSTITPSLDSCQSVWLPRTGAFTGL